MGFYETYFCSFKYILDSSSELCSKPCSQPSMKLVVALSETNASVVEFDGNT